MRVTIAFPSPPRAKIAGASAAQKRASPPNVLAPRSRWVAGRGDSRLPRICSTARGIARARRANAAARTGSGAYWRLT